MMTNKELIKKLKTIYNESTLGDIPAIIEALQDKGKPESGKVYSLTGGNGQPAISNGNTWAESEVVDCLHNFNDGICKTCGAVAPIHDAQNPTRRKAIKILEAIAERLGDEDIFDGETEGGDWYGFEDLVTEILAK